MSLKTTQAKSTPRTLPLHAPSSKLSEEELESLITRMTNYHVIMQLAMNKVQAQSTMQAFEPYYNLSVQQWERHEIKLTLPQQGVGRDEWFRKVDAFLAAEPRDDDLAGWALRIHAAFAAIEVMQVVDMNHPNDRDSGYVDYTAGKRTLQIVTPITTWPPPLLELQNIRPLIGSLYDLVDPSTKQVRRYTVTDHWVSAIKGTYYTLESPGVKPLMMMLKDLEKYESVGYSFDDEDNY